MSRRALLGVIVLAGAVLGVASCGSDPEPPDVAGRYVLDAEATETALLADLEAWAAAVAAGEAEEQEAAQVRDAHAKALDLLRQDHWSAEIVLSPDGKWDGWYEWLFPRSRPLPPPGSTSEADEPDGEPALEPHRETFSGTWTRDGERLTLDVDADRDGNHPLGQERPARATDGRLEMLNRPGRPVEVFRRR